MLDHKFLVTLTKEGENILRQFFVTQYVQKDSNDEFNDWMNKHYPYPNEHKQSLIPLKNIAKIFGNRIESAVTDIKLT